jgi:retron-type reverse transcriptase
MISLENMFVCWTEFKRGKRKKKDIQKFERFLEDNIFQLHEELISFQYHHGSYEQFRVSDPKQRLISRASVKDRLVHHMVYVALTKIFDPKLIFHSLSCRKKKGVHKGIFLLEKMIRKASKNGSGDCLALKMDIFRFFDSINHGILKRMIRRKISDEKLLRLIDLIIDSFHHSSGIFGKVGLPLGNVTSQLFANIYLNDLDNFIKQNLKLKFYLRYCDDFVILLKSPRYRLEFIERIDYFLKTSLHLTLHPRKISVSTLSKGIDFVGYVQFLHYRRLRPQTKRRLKSRLKEGLKLFHTGKLTKEKMDQKVQSYFGILSHANEFHFSLTMKNVYWVR